MDNRIDHIVVGAETLKSGGAAMESALGVAVPAGSKHEAMSTHNRVMQIGGSAFFELIAVDPEAPDPGRPRWFSLDDPATRARLALAPRPLTWVVNTPDLDALVAASPVDLGEIVDFRRGDRTWRLTVPRNGGLLMGGVLPHFIEWSPGPHPSTAQQDLGVRLACVTVRVADTAHLKTLFKSLSVSHLATIVSGEPGVAFTLETSSGPVTLH